MKENNTQNLVEVLAQNIKKRREDMGLSITGFARELGKSSGVVWQWEHSIACPGAYSLCALADVFDCTVDELLGRGK